MKREPLRWTEVTPGVYVSEEIRVRAHLCAPPSCRLRESLLAAYSATEKTEPQLGIVADIERAYAAATRRA